VEFEPVDDSWLDAPACPPPVGSDEEPPVVEPGVGAGAAATANVVVPRPVLPTALVTVSPTTSPSSAAVGVNVTT